MFFGIDLLLLIIISIRILFIIYFFIIKSYLLYYIYMFRIECNIENHGHALTQRVSQFICRRINYPI